MFINRLLTTFLCLFFIFAQLHMPGSFADNYTGVKETAHLNDKQAVAPNPDVYPEFYNKGTSRTSDAKMASSAAPQEFFGEMQSASVIQSPPATGNTERVLVIPIQFHNSATFNAATLSTSVAAIMLQLKDYYEKNSGYVTSASGISIEYTLAPIVTTGAALSYYGADTSPLGIDNLNGPIYELARDAVRLSTNLRPILLPLI